MRWRDAKNKSAIARASQPARSKGQAEAAGFLAHESGQRPAVVPPSRLYPCISTERIMRAVEHQRRISQQLEDLRTQQKQRTAFLRTTGLKCIAILCGIVGLLGSAFLILLFVRPDLLERVLDALSGAIATLLLLEESIGQGLAQIPIGSWLISGAALLVVLMMALWVRLMRVPQET